MLLVTTEHCKMYFEQVLSLAQLSASFFLLCQIALIAKLSQAPAQLGGASLYNCSWTTTTTTTTNTTTTNNR